MKTIFSIRSTEQPAVVGALLILASLVGGSTPANAGDHTPRPLEISDNYATGGGVAWGSLADTATTDDEYQFIGCGVRSSNWYAWLTNWYTVGGTYATGAVAVGSLANGRFLSQQNLGDNLTCYAKGRFDPNEPNMNTEPRYRVCYSANPSLVAHALAISRDSFIRFGWNAAGECVSLEVYNDSTLIR